MSYICYNMVMSESLHPSEAQPHTIDTGDQQNQVATEYPIFNQNLTTNPQTGDKWEVGQVADFGINPQTGEKQLGTILEIGAGNYNVAYHYTPDGAARVQEKIEAQRMAAASQKTASDMQDSARDTINDIFTPASKSRDSSESKNENVSPDTSRPDEPVSQSEISESSNEADRDKELAATEAVQELDSEHNEELIDHGNQTDRINRDNQPQLDNSGEQRRLANALESLNQRLDSLQSALTGGTRRSIEPSGNSAVRFFPALGLGFEAVDEISRETGMATDYVNGHGYTPEQRSDAIAYRNTLRSKMSDIERSESDSASEVLAHKYNTERDLRVLRDITSIAYEDSLAKKSTTPATLRSAFNHILANNTYDKNGDKISLNADKDHLRTVTDEDIEKALHDLKAVGILREPGFKLKRQGADPDGLVMGKTDIQGKDANVLGAGNSESVHPIIATKHLMGRVAGIAGIPFKKRTWGSNLRSASPKTSRGNHIIGALSDPNIRKDINVRAKGHH
jgi:hypothetical protein